MARRRDVYDVIPQGLVAAGMNLQGIAYYLAVVPSAKNKEFVLPRRFCRLAVPYALIIPYPIIKKLVLCIFCKLAADKTAPGIIDNFYIFIVANLQYKCNTYKK